MSETKIRIKGPLEKIVFQIKGLGDIMNKETQTIQIKMVEDILHSVQRFALEIEHEKINAERQIVNDCVNMDAIKFQRGIIHAMKRLQRDWLHD